MKPDNPYDDRYAGEAPYWGRNPSSLCGKILDIMRPVEANALTLFDLGCGEGRNAVYFAQHGFRVTGLDVSPVGLEKARCYAKEAGVTIETIEADITDYLPDDIYDVIFSTGTVHYLPPGMRETCFEQYKAHTSRNGINAISVLVEKPFIGKAPDAEETAFLYTSGELMSYYRDWEILYSVEDIFDCMSGGAPHRHAVNRIIARQYGGDYHGR